MILKEKKMNDYSDYITITSEVSVDTIIDNNTWESTLGILPGSTQQKMTTGNSGTITSLGAGDVTITPLNGTTAITGELTVNERNVMKELDELREALMLPSRNIKLEENYPELKEAYDTYMEVYRGIRVADRLEKTGEQYGDES
tara:strand:- start:367 stop:798 length:432 start_codon:yes stop_codon:yes gene_type:complete